MSWAHDLVLAALLCVLALAAYVDRMYIETGRFLSREYTENIDAWETLVEPRLRLSRDSAALSASVLRQLALGSIAFLMAFRLHARPVGSFQAIARTVFELILVLLVFDRLVPEVLFTRTRGVWVARVAPLLQTLFFLALPVTLTIGLLLSIAGLAEPEAAEPETPAEAMDALLEAGEEEGIFEESDRELVRSVVEFGDKVVREVMTPRPDMFAVPAAMSLGEFTAAVRQHNFSRVPVYAEALDHITGIAFARDLLAVDDADAARRTVAELERPAAFVPETKKVNELLREMQRQKQHMSIVIDEYGGVAGLVTIEDLLEAIVGNIEDEHDEPSAAETVAEPDGTFLVPGSFEVSRLRELFSDGQANDSRAPEPAEGALGVAPGVDHGDDRNHDLSQSLTQLPARFEATTVGGLISEIAGHIPLPGEVVEDAPLRLEVIASTDRLVERVRVGLVGSPATGEPE
jgi:CBS domain containing-hemolysin-like protein